LIHGHSELSVRPVPTKRSDYRPANKSPIVELLPNLVSFIDEGEITLGIREPVDCVATATDGHNCLAMLVRRKNENLWACSGHGIVALPLARGGAPWRACGLV
jgi:hypothetical protein